MRTFSLRNADWRVGEGKDSHRRWSRGLFEPRHCGLECSNEIMRAVVVVVVTLNLDNGKITWPANIESLTPKCEHNQRVSSLYDLADISNLINRFACKSSYLLLLVEWTESLSSCKSRCDDNSRLKTMHGKFRQLFLLRVKQTDTESEMTPR